MPRASSASRSSSSAPAPRALAYQLVWTRELRLVFGHSTAASAAVLAIFIGGLGAGALLIGPRADRHPRPLALYARLEAVGRAVGRVHAGFCSRSRARPTWPSGAASLSATFVVDAPAPRALGPRPARADAPDGRDPAGGGPRGRRARATPGAAPRLCLYGANTLGAVAGAVAGDVLRVRAPRQPRARCSRRASLNLVVAVAAAPPRAQRRAACPSRRRRPRAPTRRPSGPPRAASSSRPARPWVSRSSCSSSSGTGCSRRCSAAPSSPSA